MKELKQMDSVGYKAYLQSLGNQKSYIGCIPELLELEEKYKIDLDDYIPYNEDYSKVDALDALLPKEVQYNERLNFAINNYMSYKLSGYRQPGKDEDSEAKYCSDYFTFHGTEQELKEKLSSFMSKEDSLSFIHGLQNYCPNLEEGEYIDKELSLSEDDSSSDTNTMHLLLSHYDLNINIKALTLATLALLLDIKLTLGFASSTLAILGVNNQAIVRIDVTEGEKCLILEAIHSPNRIINTDVFALCRHQCVHNNLECNYKDGETCKITTDKIEKILDSLCDKNVFTKIKGFYKYNF